MIDVLVVGGGPAGLAAALYAARRGLRVEVVEPRTSPIDKACGEGLMPGGLRAVLDLVGADPTASDPATRNLRGVELAGIRYLDGRGRSSDALFRSGPGRGVRRIELQGALHEAVRAAAVPVHSGRVTALEQDVDAVTATVAATGAGGEISARYLLAADGLHSSVRSMLGLARPAAGPARFGLRRHVACSPWTDLVEVHWSPLAEAYVTPVGPDEVGIAVLTSSRRSFDEHLVLFPELGRRLRGSPWASAVRGAGPLRQRSAARGVGRVLLVGDAAGYVDALTGEGISVALASAAAAVRAVAAGRPSDYEHDWRVLSRRYRWITGSLLLAARHPTLRAAIVPAAERLPRVLSAAVDQLAR